MINNDVKLPSLFFLTGRGRSGTTLLNRMLENHSQVFLPQESPFIINLVGKYGDIKKWNEKLLKSFVNDLWVEKRLTQFWELDNLKQELNYEIINCEKPTFNKLCKIVHRYQSINKGQAKASLIGDKNPQNSLFLPEIDNVFPSSKFILITRDYRDNILSFKNISFDLNNTAALAKRWQYFNEQILDFVDHKPDNTLLLRFEDLIEDTEPQLSKVCEFLEIPFEENMLNFHKKKEKLKSWKYFYLRPADKKKLYAWKKNMSTDDVRVSDYICKETGKKLGYADANVDMKLKHKVAALPGVALGKATLVGQKAIYKVPIRVRNKVINGYRKMTKTL